MDRLPYMDLKQLEHFVTVAAEQNFTRAAVRLHIVQSGLSASIRSLEEELGVALFIRTTRRVDLTTTGRAFLVEARRVLAAAKDARHVVDELKGLHRGILSIGMIQGLSPLLDVADVLGRFRTARPNVEIRVVSGGSLSLIEGVRTGDLDLAFTQFVGSLPPGVTAWMLACEPLVAACAPWHPLAGKQNIAPRDLVEETFVDLHPDWGTRQLIDQAFAQSRLSRRIGFEVSDLTTQLDLVAHGLGIALVPQAVIAHRNRGQVPHALGTAELAEPEICWELGVVFAHDEQRHAVSAVTRVFLDLLRSSVEVLEEAEAV
ncbi:MAG: LysR family transcriptional regulator [Acetobacteraceae bacterium]|nr:LysR family transcriptional regulator [Acetobacteraceae bacterium]